MDGLADRSVTPVILALWLIESHPRLQPTLAWFLGPYMLIGFIGSFWLGMKTTHHIVDEHRSIPTAVKHALYDLRLRLAFVPLIGSWFEGDEDKTKYDDEDV